VNTLPIGTIIGGRFLIQDQLSGSGFGNSYLVRDQRNTRNNANLFVLKEVINPGRHKLYQITLDGMALRLLRHEALPRVYIVLSDAKYDRVYVLMDYIEGLSLGMLRLHQPGKRFSFPQAIIIMEPVLSAVAYLHSQQPAVLHQDIKPASIIISSTRAKVVLVDFGVGKKYNLGSTTTSARHSLTPYEAPEQYDGEIDTRSDIYGVGATFYTLLTGIVPGDALYRASKSVDSLEPMSQVVPAISMHVADAVHRAMSLSSNDRFASVQQFEQALKTDPAWVQSPKVDLRRELDLALNASPAAQKPPDLIIAPPGPLSHQSPLFTIEPSASLQPQTEASEQAVVEPVVKSLGSLQLEANATEQEATISLQPETDSSEQDVSEPIVEPPTPAQLEAHITEQESLEPVVEPSTSLSAQLGVDSSVQEVPEQTFAPVVSSQPETVTSGQESSGPMAEPSVSSESEVETPQQVSSEPPLEPLPISARLSKDAVGAQVALPLQQVLDITTTRENSAATYTYEKRGSSMDKQRQEPPHSADESREKRKSIQPPSPPQQAFPERGDLHGTLAISELEARGGTNRSIRLPGGRQTSVVVPAGAYEGQVISLVGLGEPAFPGRPRGTLTLTITLIPAKETATGPLLRKEKSTPQHFPRFFQSRALLLIGLVLLLALGGMGSMKLLSLRQRSSGTTATLTPATHTPLATRTATPRNGLYVAGTYNGSMFDQTTQQLTYISVFLVQSEGNTALSGMVTFKSPSQEVHPLHGTVDTHGNFSFTVQLAAGQTPLYFYGAVQQQGSYLKGDFCRSSTNACSVNTGYFLVGPRY